MATWDWAPPYLGTAALMVGTSGALRTFVDDPESPVPDGLFAYRLGPGTVLGGQLSEGGGLLKWANRLFRQSRATLDRAAEMAPDTHGLTVLPYTFGERGLGYHDRARGVLAGLTPMTDSAAIYRALVESIAYSFAAVDDRLAEAVPGPLAIVASGGALNHSPLLVQVIADSLGREIAVAGDLEASRRGAALLTLRGSGLLDDLTAVPRPPTRLVLSDRGPIGPVPGRSCAAAAALRSGPGGSSLGMDFGVAIRLARRYCWAQRATHPCSARVLRGEGLHEGSTNGSDSADFGHRSGRL